MPQVHRMTLELLQSAKDDLESLREQLGAASSAEVIRRSIAITKALVKLSKGRGYLKVSVEGSEETVLLVF